MPKLALVAAAVLFCILALTLVGPVMRESDQASIVSGSLRLARGESPWSASFYNYDKQFLTYWINASVLAGLKGARVVKEFNAVNVVLITNLVACVVLCAGLMSAAFRFRVNSWSGASWWVAVLCSPVLLLSSPLLSSNIISGGFLLILVSVPARGRGSVWKSILLGTVTFAAVAARLDAALCLPFVCWGMTKGNGCLRLARNRHCWIMLAGAGTAFVLGRVIHAEAAKVFYAPFFRPKIFAAYAVFGWASGLLVFILGLAILSGAVSTGRTAARRTLLRALGAACLLLPLSYYCWQMFTPRHFTTSCLLCLAFPLLPRGAATLRWAFRRRRWRLSAHAAAILGLGGLFVGLHLPVPASPRLVLADGTPYPTTDGHWPMGGTAPFLRKLARGAESPVDHNQAVWNAAGTVDYKPHVVGGSLVILETGLEAYLRLAALLDGTAPSCIEIRKMSHGRRAVVDERFFLRGTAAHYSDDHRSLRRAREEVSSLRVLAVSKGSIGRRVLALQSAPADRRENDAAFEFGRGVASLFEGDEFVAAPILDGAGRFHWRDEGRRILFASEAPFTLELRRAGGGKETLVGRRHAYRAASGVERVLFHVLLESGKTLDLDGQAWTVGAAENAEPAAVMLFRSVLPAYMSLSRYAGEARDRK